MQIFAIVVSLAIAAVGIALFVKAIRQIIAVVEGRPADGRAAPTIRGPRTVTMLKETLGHTRMLQWTGRRRGPLVRLRRLRAAVLHPAHRVRPALRRRLRAAADRPLLPLRVGHRAVHLGDARRDRGLHRLPRDPPQGARAAAPSGRFYGSTMWQGYFVEAVILGVGLCIVDAAWPRVRPDERDGEGASASPLPADVLARRGVLRDVESARWRTPSTSSRCSRSSSRSPG